MHDTLKSFDMGFMGVFEAGYGRWSLGMDVLYAKTSEDIVGGGTVFDSFRYEQKQWLLTPELAYRVIDTDRYRMDVFAGARVTILSADLTGRFARGGQAKVGNDLDFADPIIGLRGQAEIGDHFFLRYNGDIGGFGASSRLVWQAFAGFGYHISPHADVALGYRGLGIDYSEKAFTMDTVSHGPILGLEVRF
jgi:opacity protein-like surface antigen